jgi:hypothetical protein
MFLPPQVKRIYSNHAPLCRLGHTRPNVAGQTNAIAATDRDRSALLCL